MKNIKGRRPTKKTRKRKEKKYKVKKIGRAHQKKKPLFPKIKYLIMFLAWNKFC